MATGAFGFAMASTHAHHARLQRGPSAANLITTRDRLERGVVRLVDGLGRALERLRFPSYLLPQHVAPLSYRTPRAPLSQRSLQPPRKGPACQ